MKKRVAIFSLFLLVAACDASHEVLDSSSETPIVGYSINPTPNTTLYNNAKAIIDAKCLNCHGPGSGNGYLNTNFDANGVNQLINTGYIFVGPLSSSELHVCVDSTSSGNCGFSSGPGNMATRGGLTSGEIADLNAFIDDLILDPI